MVHQADSYDSLSKLTKLMHLKRWTDVLVMLQNGVSGLNIRDSCTLKYPLHLVSTAFDAPVDKLRMIMSLLLQDNAEVTEIRDKNGYTPLHLACAFGLDTVCIRLLVKANRSVCEMVTKNGDTPLSLACQRSKTSQETIKFLLSSCSLSVRSMNNMGWLPLHCGVWHNLSLFSLKAMIEIFPEAIYSRTFSSKHTPLSLFWSSHRAGELSEDEWKTVALLVSHTNVKCEGFRCDNGQVQAPSASEGLLHNVLSFPQYLPGLLESVLTKFPLEAMYRDDFGRLPLHRIIHSEGNFTMKDIRCVLGCFPMAVGIIDPQTGDLVLHAVIKNSVQRNFTWPHLAQDIFHQFPDAVYIRNKNDKLYPFMLAAQNSALDICFELLIRAPELVAHPFEV